MKWRTHKRENGELEKRKILNREKNIFLVYLSWLSHNKPNQVGCVKINLTHDVQVKFSLNLLSLLTLDHVNQEILGLYLLN